MKSATSPGTRRPPRTSIIILVSALLGLAVSAAHAEPVVYLASPEALKAKETWEITVDGGPDEATIHIKGTHPYAPKDCVQKPYLKVRYNQRKARIKTRQMEKITCRTTEQSATIEPKRRAIEFYINGELTAFIDLEGASAGTSEPVSEPLVLPVAPKPKEPVFILVPVREASEGCYAIRKVKVAKRGKKVKVKYKVKKRPSCDEERAAFQILARVGPLRKKGEYSLVVGDDTYPFGIGVAPPPRPPRDEEPEEAPPEDQATTEAGPSEVTSAKVAPEDTEGSEGEDEDAWEDEDDTPAAPATVQAKPEVAAAAAGKEEPKAAKEEPDPLKEETAKALRGVSEIDVY